MSEQPKDRPAELLWLDLETTSLDPETTQILEIAWGFTALNGSMEITDRFEEIVIHQLVDWSRVDPVVHEMHRSSGLVDEVARSTMTLERAEAIIGEVIEQRRDGYDDGVDFHLAGSTIRYDLACAKRHMPRIVRFLHYRTVDVSSIALMFRSAGFWIPAPNPKPHRAGPDIAASLACYRQFQALAEDGVCAPRIGVRV